MKALLLDDSKTALKHLEMVIHQVNPNVETTKCETFEEALESLQSSHYDIIFCDLQLPTRNGADLLMYMDQHQEFKDIRKVIVTGTGHDSLLKTSLEKAVDAYLHKPIKKEDLLTLLA